MSPAHFDERYGGSAPENYERYFVPTIGAPLAEDLVDSAALGPGERVLDVACGTGVVARRAAAKVTASGSVVGLDMNPGMLAVARSSTPSGTSIDWRETSAEAMPLPDESFDAVLCQMGLQFFPDRLAALREMRRVLAPGGRLVLNVPGPIPPLLEIFADALARNVGPEAAGFVHRVFSLHDADELRELVSRAGLADATVNASVKTLRLPSPTDFLWQYVSSTPLSDAVANVDGEHRIALEREVQENWQAFVEDEWMRLPLRVTIVTAYRRLASEPWLRGDSSYPVVARSSARRARVRRVEVLEVASAGGTHWWESELDTLRSSLWSDVRRRLPAVVAEHEDLVQDTLASLVKEMRKRRRHYPSTWWSTRGEGVPVEDRDYFHALARTILRRRIADRFASESRRWAVDVLQKKTEAGSAQERRQQMRQVLAIMLEVLQEVPEADRELLARVSLSAPPPPLSDGDRQRLRRLRARLRSRLEQRLGADPRELMTDD